MVVEIVVVMDEITEEGREGLKEEGLELSSGEFQHLLLCRKKGKTSGISEVQGKLRECW